MHAAIVVAAGSGERLGRSEPKAFVEVAARTLLAMAAGAAVASELVDALAVAVPSGWEERAEDVLAELDVPVRVVTGADTRHASVAAGLLAVPQECTRIFVHDAARPFASPALFGEVLAGLGIARGVVPVVPVPDTVKRVRGHVVVGTEERSELWLAQTPQAFEADALRDAHRRAIETGREFGDDAAALEWAGYRVRVVEGEPGNFKVTTPTDLLRAELLVASRGGRRTPGSTDPSAAPSRGGGTEGAPDERDG